MDRGLSVISTGEAGRGPIAKTSIKLIKTPLAGPRLWAMWSRKSSILAFEAQFVLFVMRLA